MPRLRIIPASDLEHSSPPRDQPVFISVLHRLHWAFRLDPRSCSQVYGLPRCPPDLEFRKGWIPEAKEELCPNRQCLTQIERKELWWTRFVGCSSSENGSQLTPFLRSISPNEDPPFSHFLGHRCFVSPPGLDSTMLSRTAPQDRRGLPQNDTPHHWTWERRTRVFTVH